MQLCETDIQLWNLSDKTMKPIARCLQALCVTALLGSGLRVRRLAEHPVDWWGGHRDVRPAERGRLPLSFSVVATRD